MILDFAPQGGAHLIQTSLRGCQRGTYLVRRKRRMISSWPCFAANALMHGELICGSPLSGCGPMGLANPPRLVGLGDAKDSFRVCTEMMRRSRLTSGWTFKMTWMLLGSDRGAGSGQEWTGRRY